MAVVIPNISNEALATALNQASVRGRGKISVEIEGCRIDDVWATGSPAWFEYHCSESHESSDSPAWYHSHQQVEVLGLTDCEQVPSTTFGERMDEGMVLVYRVWFDDGLEWDVFEDELLMDPSQFDRPDPPKPRMETERP